MRPILTVVLLFLNSMQLDAQSNQRAESEIRKQVTALESAFNKHDAAALAAVYASDGDAIFNDAPVVTGRSALRASAAADMANQSSTLRISITPTSLRFLSPDVAIVNTVAHFNEGSVREDRGSLVLFAERGNGSSQRSVSFPPSTNSGDVANAEADRIVVCLTLSALRAS